MLNVIESKLQWIKADLSVYAKTLDIRVEAVEEYIDDFYERASEGKKSAHDFHESCKELGIFGDFVMALNHLMKCHYLIKREPANESDILNCLCVTVRLHERIKLNTAQAAVLPEVWSELRAEDRSKFAARAAKAKHAIDPKQAEKEFVRDCWKDWVRNEPGRYRSKAAFAKAMLDKCDHLESQKKIEDWCREWEKLSPC